ncbi:MAG: hypothetical protein ABIH52_03160 [Candidatus Aenigmatarchaeota archaeon]|nr:hypothetical protein [Nanoarchaeota archaeon]
MFIIPFALIDLLVGIALATSAYFDFAGNNLIFYLAIVGLLKGVYSILTAMAAGFYYDVIGWIDVVAGILLMTTTWGIASHIFLYLGIIVILKGIYSFMMGLVTQN